MIWLKKKGIGFLYNFKDKKTLAINSNRTISTYIDDKILAFYSRIYRTDPENQNLFYKAQSKKIKILTGVAFTGYVDLLELNTKFSVQDFYPLTEDKILTMGIDGQIAIYTYDPLQDEENFVESQIIQLDLQKSQKMKEVCGTLAVSVDESKFVIGLCDRKRKSALTRVMAFTYNQMDEINKLQVEKVFYPEGEGPPNSWFNHFNVSHCLATGKTLVIGVQQDAEHRMVAFSMRDDGLQLIADGIKAFTDKSYRSCYIGSGRFLSIDNSGTIILVEVIPRKLKIGM